MEKLRRTIRAVAVKNKSQGNMAFLTEEEDKRWFNISAPEATLDQILDTVIQKGNIIEYEIENGSPKNFTLIEKAKPKESFSDDLTSFEDLLDSAHKMFRAMFTIKTELIENDWENQRAIFKARVMVTDPMPIEDTETGKENYEMRTFEAYGDATQDNCGDMIKKHYIRMAETRAISRALRWATNNAKAAIEETEHETEE